MKQDEELTGRIDIAFYGYPTGLIRWPWSNRSNRIQDLSKALRTEFAARFSIYSEVIIVAHSMGGLIAQKYIIEELKEKPTLKVSGLILFAVPTEGASLAKWGDLVSFRHSHLRQLKKESETLESIRADWRALSCGTKLQVIAVYGGQDKVVTRVGEAIEKFEFVADEDHGSIVKPKSNTSTTFLIVRNFVRDHIKRRDHSPIETPGDRHSTPRFKADVLFDMYRPKLEPFYVERREDLVLNGYVERQNIWLFGPSGYGKTAALTRSLARTEAFRLISLGHYAGYTVRELFAALYESLADDRNVSATDLSWPRLIEAIAAELNRLSKQNLKWIFVEEMPIGEPHDLGEFLSRLSSLLILHAQSRNTQTISFAFSSVADPSSGVKDLARTSQILKIIKFSEWRSRDIRRLLQMILGELAIELSDADQDTILSSSAMSPRFIKVFFGNYLSLLPMTREPRAAMEEALASTKSEVFR